MRMINYSFFHNNKFSCFGRFISMASDLFVLLKNNYWQKLFYGLLFDHSFSEGSFRIEKIQRTIFWILYKLFMLFLVWKNHSCCVDLRKPADSCILPVNNKPVIYKYKGYITRSPQWVPCFFILFYFGISFPKNGRLRKWPPAIINNIRRWS